MSVTPYYMRVSRDSTSAFMEISDDSMFSNIIGSVSLNVDTPVSYIITVLDDGQVQLEISGGEPSSFFADEGCASLAFISASGYNLDTEYTVTLQPGNLQIELGETRFNEFVASGPPNPWQITACCIHPMTTIRTTKGPKCIKNIKSGDLVYNYKGEEVEILFNIEYKIPSSEFFKLKRGSIRKNVPQTDIFLTKEHPIIFKNMVRSVGDIKIAENVKTAPTIVYNLCTKNQEFLDIQGVPVSSYSKVAWEEFSKKHGTNFKKK